MRTGSRVASARADTSSPGALSCRPGAVTIIVCARSAPSARASFAYPRHARASVRTVLRESVPVRAISSPSPSRSRFSSTTATRPSGETSATRTRAVFDPTSTTATRIPGIVARAPDGPGGRDGYDGRTSGLYAMRCGSRASGPRVSRTQSAYSPRASPRTTSPGSRPRRPGCWSRRGRGTTGRGVTTIGAPSKRDQRFLETAQRREVEVVGRLVEHEHVAAGAQELGEQHAVPLAARELRDPRALRRGGEKESSRKLCTRTLARRPARRRSCLRPPR